MLFVFASRRTLRKLIAVKTAMRTTATATPVPVSTFWPPLCFIHPLANDQCWPYWMTAMTSIGATVAACSQENQPNEAPTAPPNA